MIKRIRLSSVTKGLVLLAMMMALSFAKIFGGVFEHPNVTKISILVLFMFANICILHHYNDLSNMVKISIALAIIMCIWALFQSNVSFKTYVSATFDYLFVIGAAPIYYLLSSRKWDFRDALKTITGLTMISYILRIYISVYEKITSLTILPSIALESAQKGWYRKGFLRINPPCFGIVLIPIVFYLFVQSDKKREKIYYGFVIALVIFYSYIIHGSRSVFLYNIIEILFVAIYQKKNSRKQIAVWSIIAIFLVVIINSDVFDAFFNSFSTSGKEGYSSRSRIMSYGYYFTKWLEKPLRGQGILPVEKHYVTTVTSSGELRGALGDIGFFYTIFRFGITGMIFYFYLFWNSLKAGINCRKNLSNNLDVLIIGIALSLFITGINIDMFFPIYSFSVPVCVAIISYANDYSCKHDVFNTK